MFYTIKLWVARIDSMINQLLYFGGSNIVLPGRIKSEVEAAAWRLAVCWDRSEISYPDTYALYFDNQSWDFYYSKRIAETQRRIRSMVEHLSNRTKNRRGLTSKSFLNKTSHFRNTRSKWMLPFLSARYRRTALEL